MMLTSLPNQSFSSDVSAPGSHAQVTSTLSNPPKSDFTEEIHCVENLCNALRQATNTLLLGGGGSGAPLPLTLRTVSSETMELLEMLLCVVRVDSDCHRIQSILFPPNRLSADIFALITLLICPTLDASEGFLAGTMPPRSDVYVQVQCASLRTLAQLVALCAPKNDSDVDSQLGDHSLSTTVADVLVRLQTFERLFVLLRNKLTPDELKSATVECLFVLIMRNAVLRHRFIHSGVCGTIDMFVRSLATESCLRVRSYIAACVRELSNTYARELISEGVTEVLLNIGTIDVAPDVRTLTFETLDVLARYSSTVTLQTSSSSAAAKKIVNVGLADLLIQRLERETNAEVLETIGRLVETSVIHDAKWRAYNGPDSLDTAFTDQFLAHRGERLLVQCLRQTPRTAASMARGLRVLIQYAPYYKEAALSLVSHFPSISVVLKICVDFAPDVIQHTAVPRETGNPPTLPESGNPAPGAELSTELSLLVALCFAQSVDNRRILQRELSTHEAWIQTLRRALLHHLHYVTLERLTGLYIVDSTGTILNESRQPSTGLVLWEGGSMDRPNKQAIKDIFIEQERRRETPPRVPSQPNLMRLFSTAPVTELEKMRHLKLTFVLLSYATHLALTGSIPLEAQNEARRTAHPGLGSMHSPGWAEPPQAIAAAQHPKPTTHTLPTEPFSAYVPEEAHPMERLGYGSVPPPPSGNLTAAAAISPHNPVRDHIHYSYGNDRFAPAPTRTSILREARAHPNRLQALSMATKAQGGGGGAMAAVKSGAAPRYYSPSVAARSASAGLRSRTWMTMQGVEHNGEMFSKFDAAFTLATRFAIYYRKPRTGKDAKQPSLPKYVATQDGLFVREVPPWEPPVVRRKVTTWSVADIKEGDLFFFSIPLQEVSADVFRAVLERARRHARSVKRLLITTPQVAKGRRWFLHDMSNQIMPKTIEMLEEYLTWIQQRGDNTIKFPIFLFREKELATGQRAVHSGNALEVLDCIRNYFAQNDDEENARTVHGVPQSQYLKDIEAKILALSKQQFTGTEVDDLSDEEDDKDDDDDEDDDEDDDGGGDKDDDEDDEDENSITHRAPGTHGMEGSNRFTGHGGLDSDASTVSSERD